MKKLTAILPLAVCPVMAVAQTAGHLTEEHWNGVSGTTLDKLKQEMTLRAPNTTLLRPAAEAPQNSGSYYGRRMHGTITAPVTGAYTFFIAGAYHVELNLSENESGLNKKRIAYHDNWSYYNQWFRYETQRSHVVHLEAGGKYYIEALQKEHNGADSLSIGWSYTTAVPQANNFGANSVAAWTGEKGSYAVNNVQDGTVWGSSDDCAFSGRETSGDFEAVVRLGDVTNAGDAAKVGLMVRSSLDADAVHAFLLWSGNDAMEYQIRKTVAGSSYAVINPLPAKWLKIKRFGNVFHGYVSGDGKHWTKLGHYTLNAMPAMAHVGLAATNASGSQPLAANFTNFQVQTFAADEVIPASQLTSFTVDSADSDSSGLPDTWETQLPLTGSAWDKSQFGDPDGDFISNLEEAQANTDPNVPNSKQGQWTLEKWTGLALYDVNELRLEDSYYQPAGLKQLHEGSRHTDLNQGDSIRMRGYITAPESGEYRFWLSSSNAAELWISTDDSKARKQRVAVMGSGAGTGHGIREHDSNLFDQFASQMSEPIQLEAGQKYFIEALSSQFHIANRHVSIAWARPSADREFLPLEFLESYVDLDTDQDDDSLPDAWEMQYGLSATDNGLVDREREGENGDADFDGLSNRLEYVYGTDPSNPDSDGDGINDGQEIYSYGSDPAVSDAPAEMLIATLDLNTFSSETTEWEMSFGSLVPESFRGDAQWTFSVPEDGYWNINVKTRLLGDIYLNEKVAASMSVNGTQIWKDSILYGQSRNGQLRVTSQFLKAGQHTVTLNIDNMVARRSVAIASIGIYKPEGLDANGDGYPDWVYSQLVGANTLSPYQGGSYTSPAFLEGSARISSGVMLDSQSVMAGTHYNHWYTNLVLKEDQTTHFDVQFEDGIASYGEITWLSANVLEVGSLIIRKGDKVKLGAWTADESGSATVTVEGSSHSLAEAQDYLVHTFDTAGKHTISAAHSDGATAELTVHVKQAELDANTQDILENTVGNVSLPAATVDSDLYFDTGEAADLLSSSVSGDQILLKVSPHSTDAVKLAVRLHKDGPILATQSLNLIEISDALQNDLTSFETSIEFPTYYVVNAPFVVSDLPAGARIKITIFRSGVTFLDGSKEMWLDVEDLDANGIAQLQFLFPVGMEGGYCHYIDIYDRNGVLIGRR